MNLDAIPASLRAECRFVVARSEVRDGRATKVPYVGFDINRKASSTDPATWADFDTARRVVESGQAPMLGFMLEGSGLFGIDLDHCRDSHSGAIDPWARDIIAMNDSYTEASVSGTGVHIIARGSLPPGRRRTGKRGEFPPVPAGSEVEMYDSGRYFVMTGEIIGGQDTLHERTAQVALVHGRLFGSASAPAPEGQSQPVAGILDDDLLKKIRQSKQAEKFEKLWAGDTSMHGKDDSAADLALCTILAFWTQRNRERIDRLFRQSGLYRQKWEREDYRSQTIDRACRINDVYNPRMLTLDPGEPLASAREFVVREHTIGGTRALQHQHGVFYQFDSAASAYYERDEASVRAALYHFLDRALAWDGEKERFAPFKPTKAKVESVLDALRAVCNLPMTQVAPCWLGNDPGLNPIDMLACQSGLLHISTRTLHPATPTFFTLNGIDFAYDRQARAPQEWLTFLTSVWPDDQESIDTLQEIFGYYLTPDTRFQKIAMVVGPKRSGKGTIARVLRRVIGARNVCSPTLAAFGRDFGKQVLIGKSLAVISDARISGRTDTAVVAETLLSISGEDDQTVERKFLPDWSGRLGVRFMLLANELPRIGDASGALASRFIVLVMKQSFFGREDLGLTDRLLRELPGILNWALEGRDRLYSRGHFVQPQSANQMIEEFNDLSSPEAAFLRERCEVRAGAEVAQSDLFDAWLTWCQDNGHKHPGTKQTFGRNVRAALPWIDDQLRREGEGRSRYWLGLGLLPQREADEAPRQLIPREELPF